METNPVFETLFSSYLELRTVDKVQKSSDSKSFLLKLLNLVCLCVSLDSFKIVQFFYCPTLRQTMDLTARLPAAEGSNLGSASIRVLVVDPEGLVTIYSPVSPSESVSPAVTLGSDVRSKVISKVMAGHRKKINTEVTPTTTKSPTAVSRQWSEAP
jgi:hypothetical protein